MRRSSTSTSISRRGRVNPASRLAASSGAATGSALSLLTCSKETGFDAAGTKVLGELLADELDRWPRHGLG